LRRSRLATERMTAMRTLFFLIALVTDYRALAELARECASLGIINATFIFLLGSFQLIRHAKRNPIARR
jgi:hypothetical protein